MNTENMILNNAGSYRADAREKNVIRSAQNASSPRGKNSFQTHLTKAIEEKNINAHKKPVDKKLMNVCIEMESLLVARMLKVMRKTIHKTKWINGGPGEKIFEDMLYDKYSLNISKNANLGLAKMLYEEMSRK